ncbi:MAG: Riboflavin transporter RibU [Firmicutes bacterium ADurb.Bin300]|nr:MAG: Riboflavin transporter RibU [Firmicutes bacterium ADurb.Bin300]HOD02006.1 ECF transporter S component [Clostridiales bacterium]
MKREKLKKSVIISMLAALSFLSVVLIRIPVVLFLSYEPKDVIITIGGFLFGPLVSALISLIVSFVEMVTISTTGPIGMLMNFIATCSFACTAAVIYKRKRTVSGAVTGLVLGVFSMVLVMLFWNYLITPLYMGVSREAVAEILVPAILPFNLLKAFINAALTMLLYKPVSIALRKAHLLPEKALESNKRRSIGIALVSLTVIITCILFILALKGII